MSNRIIRTSSGTVRKYVVDIASDLPTMLLETDTSDGFLKRIYVYANGEILMQHDGDYTGNRHFYPHDRLGKVREVIDQLQRH